MQVLLIKAYLLLKIYFKLLWAIVEECQEKHVGEKILFEMDLADSYNNDVKEHLLEAYEDYLDYHSRSSDLFEIEYGKLEVCCRENY